MKKFLLVFMMLFLSFSGNFLRVSFVFAEEEKEDLLGEIYIKAVNPGYTVDSINNVGEMIEIGRKSSDEMISLAGTTISYTNSSGNTSIILEFPENSWMSGESILLRLASSPGYELAAMNYTKTLAFKGGIQLLRDGEVVDEVCWTGKEGCYKDFKSGSMISLVRDLETREFLQVENYEPVYDETSFFVKKDEEGYGEVRSQCLGVQFSEVLSYYENSADEQFIEFYNPTQDQILLDGCKIKYKNKFYPINGILKPEGYSVRFLNDFNLTKNPASVNTLEIIDINGETVDTLGHPNGQRKGTSYAFIGYDEKGGEIWHVTYAPTPGEPNNYQEYKTCEAGKVINEETGNCVKVTSVTEKVCGEGQYLNILTGRCRKYEVTTEKTCKEGYYLNEETGRCKKIQDNTGADYGLTPETYEEKSSFIALYAILGVVLLGIGYAIYEFRAEFKKCFDKVFRRSR